MAGPRPRPRQFPFYNRELRAFSFFPFFPIPRATWIGVVQGFLYTSSVRVEFHTHCLLSTFRSAIHIHILSIAIYTCISTTTTATKPTSFHFCWNSWNHVFSTLYSPILKETYHNQNIQERKRQNERKHCHRRHHHRPIHHPRHRRILHSYNEEPHRTLPETRSWRGKRWWSRGLNSEWKVAQLPSAFIEALLSRNPRD